MSVAAAISIYNVEKLHISVERDKTTERFWIPIPPGIFLSLRLGAGWKVPDIVWLPNAKYLHLISFRLVDEDSIQRCLQGCPLLANLAFIVESFSYENKEGVEALQILNPLLKNLALLWNEKVESEFNVVVKSENLESLLCSLEAQHKVFNNYFGEDEEFDSISPQALPPTLIEHLKVIEMSNFKGEEHEFKLVEYFLKNGKSLKKTALEREGWKSVPNHCDRILSLKKCSEDCQIIFRKK